ncbi:hypothetical protein [Streptomyces albicerus]|uniref:hypothetical protein n=1 Tax=Streptomyces albicerus TaxID=2569859 RepID=UPI001CEDAE3D|nr:hypothetical protein [Streptomyces albicerus]
MLPPSGDGMSDASFCTAAQERVLVITWWDAAYDADLPELPELSRELVTGAVRRWRFEPVPEA